MSQADAFFLVGRDLLWTLIWLLPVLTLAFADDKNRIERIFWGVLFYGFVCLLCYFAGAGQL